MNRRLGQYQQLRQTQQIAPEQIVVGELLQLTTLELSQRIRVEMDRNPTLALEESARCPICDLSMAGRRCSSCGFSGATDDVPTVCLEDWETYRHYCHDGDTEDRFGAVASRRPLRDELKEQWAVVCDPAAARIGEYLIDCLDDTGYLTEPLIDIAGHFRTSVPQIESVLRQIQDLDPPGVGARTLRECLEIQLRRRSDEDDRVRLAARIVRDAWEPFGRHQWCVISRLLDVDGAAVDAAVAWIRRNLAPYPGQAYLDPWRTLSPADAPRAVPDAIISAGADRLHVEIVESSRHWLKIDDEYQRLYRSLGRSSANVTRDTQYVRQSIGEATLLLKGIAQRRRTLHQVVSAVADAQAEFLLRGRAYLKPLLQKTIASRIGVHESTVCRAVMDKMIQIPSGETIPAAIFFDASLSAKEVLEDFVRRENPSDPLSDSRLMELLNHSGHTLARRTVAKYRESLGIPAVGQRRAG